MERRNKIPPYIRRITELEMERLKQKRDYCGHAGLNQVEKFDLKYAEVRR